MRKFRINERQYIKAKIIEKEQLPKTGDNQRYSDTEFVNKILEVSHDCEAYRDDDYNYDLYAVYYNSNDNEDNEYYEKDVGHYSDVEYYAIYNRED